MTYPFFCQAFKTCVFKGAILRDNLEPFPRFFSRAVSERGLPRGVSMGMFLGCFQVALSRGIFDGRLPCAFL